MQLIFNDKYFYGRNFSRPKFICIGCLLTLGTKVAWTDAGKFESHFTGHHCMFAKSIPERDSLNNSLEYKKQPFVAVTEYRGQVVAEVYLSPI